MKSFLAILFILAFSVTAFAIDHVVQDFMDVFEEMDELSLQCDEATTPAQQAAILNQFANLLGDLQTRSAALEEKYPNMDEDNMPEGMGDLNELGERFMVAFFTIYAVGAENTEETQVAAAYEKIDAQLTAIMGEDSWEE